MHLAPHPFTLRQLQYAVAVAEASSFRRAALACHVSQPSLSAQIAQVENALGLRLFERDRRRVVPTDAGREILERARRLLVDAGDLVETARRRSDPLTGTVRIGVIPTVAPYLVPEAARRLRARFPRLAVVWIEDKTAVLAALLGSGGLDAALVALPMPATAGDVLHEEIATDEFVLATPPGHPLAAVATPAKAADLSGASLLLLDDGHCLREQALAVCSRAGVREPSFRATSLPTLVQMVSGGSGVTLLPRLALPLEGSRAELSIRPFATPAPHRTVALVWRRRSFLADTLRALGVEIRSAYPPAARAPGRTRSPRPRFHRGPPTRRPAR